MSALALLGDYGSDDDDYSEEESGGDASARAIPLHDAPAVEYNDAEIEAPDTGKSALFSLPLPKFHVIKKDDNGSSSNKRSKVLHKSAPPQTRAANDDAPRATAPATSLAAPTHRPAGSGLLAFLPAPAASSAPRNISADARPLNAAKTNAQPIRATNAPVHAPMADTLGSSSASASASAFPNPQPSMPSSYCANDMYNLSTDAVSAPPEYQYQYQQYYEQQMRTSTHFQHQQQAHVSTTSASTDFSSFAASDDSVRLKMHCLVSFSRYEYSFPCILVIYTLLPIYRLHCLLLPPSSPRHSWLARLRRTFGEAARDSSTSNRTI
jgi:hypothetical protein